ncbi:leucine carboxyl methyltransferase 2-like protein [Radiomyces spectabilis]|uniref:leucine carboxyl methyltransferase 2-like protein n=1 Tax=Radiomyces spectabilis TaxID=64574 RepID=UPI00221E8BF0|nr:leucine carboxyl methyltransferase 2-like protein [Radiomyces spectabilis]KAI8370346.1 leucine carboxyl methyltransferase 2-like protein [Radiomyces spectabilis]
MREDPETYDTAIRATNDDATISRLSAVRLGYFSDPFVHYFVRRPITRSPIINRGSYIRNFALNSLLQQFIGIPTDKKKQIVSLGAGFDTRYFMLQSGQLGGNDRVTGQLHRYFEVDFPEIAMKKAMTIKRHAELNKWLGDRVIVEKGGMELKGDDYSLIGGDLREWHNIVQRLLYHGFDMNAMTLFVSECVFIYLSPTDSTTILQWITDHIEDAMFTLYEQIHPSDAFGQMMIRNLQYRNIELKGIHAYPDLSDQEKRFKALNWDGAKAVDINTIHDKCLDNKEKGRMARLEILDELEEWHLLSAHYCVAWAYKSGSTKEAFAAIDLLPH